MRACLEFGRKGGFHVDNLVLPSVVLGAKIASCLANLLSDRISDYSYQYFIVNRSTPRVTWENSEFFVALSRLDGVQRGPASAKLWKR